MEGGWEGSHLTPVFSPPFSSIGFKSFFSLANSLTQVCLPVCANEQLLPSPGTEARVETTGCSGSRGVCGTALHAGAGQGWGEARKERQRN